VAAAALAAGLAAAAVAGETPRALALDRAIAEALQYNLSLAQGAVNVRSRTLGVEQAKAAFDLTGGPLVRAGSPDGETEWTYGLQGSKRFGGGTELAVAGTVTEGGASDPGGGGALTVDLAQPLFRRFGRSVAQEPVFAADDQLRGERRRWEEQKSDLVLELVVLFETIVRLDAQVVFEKAYASRLERLAALGRVRERQGRSSRADVLRIDVQRGESEARLAGAIERRGIASRELADLLGADPDVPIAPEPPPDLVLDIPPSDLAVAAAFSNRMDFAQACDDASVARRQGALARRYRWPDVTLNVSMRRDDGESFDRAVSEGDTQWFVLASSEGSPWRRADRLVMAQAAAAEESAGLALEVRRRLIARRVLQAIAECRRTAAELDIAARNRQLAEDRSRLSRRLYVIGRGDSFSVSDAEGQQADAENRLFEARSAARLAQYALLHAMGALIEHPRELAAGPEDLP
jgi:outer membrane protein TolC